MGCRSDYMESSNYEVKLSRVACLLDEINGRPYQESWWAGYHPRIYNGGDGSVKSADQLVNELCSILQNSDVKQYSLEMQIWWRDHQAADKLRCQRELEKAKNDKDREIALNKLTPHERRLLGL